ncbi:MAG: DUF3850 domain-containing protein [Rhodocyclaceae bacterium]|nr:DUF3850 domain-containing protein [Rhodocyclaceae bacterium]MBX3668574.1 DUF3850 domain-containing protein [Rhodocyclaceae bacterium]
MEHTIWLLPDIFDQIWRDERSYVICENLRGLGAGDMVHIEEGNKTGSRTGRSLDARVSALTPGGKEGLPHDLSVLGVAVVAKRSRV